MTTKFILNKKLEAFAYPVGTHINHNISLIEIMVEEFIEISEYKDKYINIICRGSSGAIIAAIFAMKVPNVCQIVHVKKPGENSHNNSVSLSEDNAINIIVDDLIASGSTMNAIWNCVKDKTKDFKIHCVLVGGCSKIDSLDFEPDYFICEEK